MNCELCGHPLPKTEMTEDEKLAEVFGRILHPTGVWASDQKDRLLACVAKAREVLAPQDVVPNQEYARVLNERHELAKTTIELHKCLYEIAPNELRNDEGVTATAIRLLRQRKPKGTILPEGAAALAWQSRAEKYERERDAEMERLNRLGIFFAQEMPPERLDTGEDIVDRAVRLLRQWKAEIARLNTKLNETLTDGLVGDGCSREVAAALCGQRLDIEKHIYPKDVPSDTPSFEPLRGSASTDKAPVPSTAYGMSVPLSFKGEATMDGNQAWVQAKEPGPVENVNQDQREQRVRQMYAVVNQGMILDQLSTTCRDVWFRAYDLMAAHFGKEVEELRTKDAAWEKSARESIAEGEELETKLREARAERNAALDERDKARAGLAELRIKADAWEKLAREGIAARREGYDSGHAKGYATCEADVFELARKRGWDNFVLELKQYNHVGAAKKTGCPDCNHPAHRAGECEVCPCLTFTG